MTKQSGLYGLNEKIGGDLQGEPIFEMKTERLACRRANDRRVLQEQSAFGGGLFATGVFTGGQPL